MRSSTLNCLSFIWPLTRQRGRKYSSHCLRWFRKSQTSRPTDLMSGRPDDGMHGLSSKGRPVKYNYAPRGDTTWCLGVFRCLHVIHSVKEINLKWTFKKRNLRLKTNWEKYNHNLNIISLTGLAPIDLIVPTGNVWTVIWYVAELIISDAIWYNNTSVPITTQTVNHSWGTTLAAAFVPSFIFHVTPFVHVPEGRGHTYRWYLIWKLFLKRRMQEKVALKLWIWK